MAGGFRSLTRFVLVILSLCYARTVPDHSCLMQGITFPPQSRVRSDTVCVSFGSGLQNSDPMFGGLNTSNARAKVLHCFTERDTCLRL